MSMNYTAIVIAVCIAVACVAAASLAALIILYNLKKSVRSIELDDITGLPTFAKFKHDVRQILRNANPDEYMFLMLNVDNFNFINDSYGFSRGNLLLLELANHFSSQLQDGEILCRYYADTFILFTKNPQLLPLIEERVYQMTTMPRQIQELLPTRYTLTFSTSVYYITDPSGDLTNMIDKANIARKIGKENVLTHRVMEYTKAMDEENELKKEITLSMDKAIENKEFEVYFQPKVYFDNGKIMGAEALIRWNKPDRGLMTPDSFVPLFEHNGFIQKIDISVLEEVCHFLDDWSHAAPDGTCPMPLTISFNLSRTHLMNPNLIRDLQRIVSKYNILPNHIEVELTETVMFENKKRLIRAMNDMKRVGFSISVDDFGSGFSSLNLLKDMPADVIKLDKGFLSDGENNSKEAVIITSVIDMAKKLNMKTVAEGVETKEQAQFLRTMGCDIAQGFYYARPMPKKDYLAMLEEEYLA